MQPAPLRVSLLAGFGFACLALSPAAPAQLYTVSTYASAEGTTNSSFPVNGTYSHTLVSTTNATGEAVAQMGSLGAYAEGRSGLGPSSKVDALATFGDTLYVHGSGTMQLTLTLSGQFRQPFANPGEDVIMYAQVIDTTNHTSASLDFATDYPFLGSDPFSVQDAKDFTVADGDTLNVSSSLEAYVTNASEISDFLHTGHVYLDPQSPGLSLTSASGHNYITPTDVPEPGSIVLLASFGLTGAAFLARRRKQTRQAA